MIFLTVGTQLPFERLVKAIDQYAAIYPNVEIFGQIGPSSYIPSNFEYKNFISKNEYDEKFNSASLIISHAGMGTIISSLICNKPVIVLPRLASIGEHRNDHQLATCKRLNGITGLHIAEDERNLIDLVKSNDLSSPLSIDNLSLNNLVDNLKTHIDRHF